MKEIPSIVALPVKASDLYFEVVNRFVLDYTKKEIPSEVTLDKLAEFAAQLLQERRFLFGEEDMKKFSLEEIGSLRASGLLHCGPSFRKSFSQVTKHFCFTHITLQEYLASRWFVKRRVIPCRQNVSSVVMQFMSGILSKEGNTDKFMKELLEEFPSPKDILLTAKCLFEYQDKEFAKIIIKKRHREYFERTSERGVNFFELTEMDCTAVSFLLEVISALKEEASTECQTVCEQPYRSVNLLMITDSRDLSQSGFRRICKMLEKDFCTITKLWVMLCELNDEYADCIKGLVSSRLEELELNFNHITDAGVDNLCQALHSSNCKVTSLSLDINQITDAGVFSLCHVLQSSACGITSLSLRDNRITDAGVYRLCQSLQSSASQVTKLFLDNNKITDAGVVYLCQALQSSTCQVATLELGGNTISVAGVATLCKALQLSTCRVTSLSPGFGRGFA